MYKKLDESQNQHHSASAWIIIYIYFQQKCLSKCKLNLLKIPIFSRINFSVILCALFALIAFSATPTGAQLLYNPYYYPYAAAYYNPYYGYVWGSNKGESGPEAPQPPVGGPSFTNNAPRL